MKKKVMAKDERSFRLVDVTLVKWSAGLGIFWFLGLLAYWIEPSSIMNFVVRWRWLAFVLMLIFAVRPIRKFFGGGR